jgi:hypothetical protein
MHFVGLIGFEAHLCLQLNTDIRSLFHWLNMGSFNLWYSSNITARPKISAIRQHCAAGNLLGCWFNACIREVAIALGKCLLIIRNQKAGPWLLNLLTLFIRYTGSIKEYDKGGASLVINVQISYCMSECVCTGIYVCFEYSKYDWAILFLHIGRCISAMQIDPAGPGRQGCKKGVA